MYHRGRKQGKQRGLMELLQLRNLGKSFHGAETQTYEDGEVFPLCWCL